MAIFENTCRTCNNMSTELLNIHTDRVLDNSLLIATALNLCNPNKDQVRIDDEYPEGICLICAKKLEVAYKFLTKWQASQAEFDVALKFEHRRKRLRLSREATKRPAEATSPPPPPVAASSPTASPPPASPPPAPQPKPQQTTTSQTDKKSQKLSKTSQKVKSEEDCTTATNEKATQNVKQLNENESIIELAIENSLFVDRLNEEDLIIASTSGENIVKFEIPENAMLMCALCNKSFYTAKAIEMHQKLSHRNFAITFSTG